jgi:hypothetical protein
MDDRWMAGWVGEQAGGQIDRQLDRDLVMVDMRNTLRDSLF